MVRRSVFALFMVVVCAWVLRASPLAALTIGGVVRQPLNLSTEDLARFESATVRLNELTRDNRFRGVFAYRGVPLRTLLEFASVQKEESSFGKPLDLAVVVRNKEGKRTVLSWGEIFHRNPSEIVVATSAGPIVPHHTNCGECHDAKIYEPALNQLKRKVGLPKLVVANDFFTDRSLEDIVHIDVMEMKQKTEKRQMGKLFSPKFTVLDGKGRSVEVSDLSGYTRIEADKKNISDGRGYHGWRRYSGVSLRELLTKTAMGQDADTVVLASSIDGYRVLISYGELFLSPGGERIMIADGIRGRPLEEGKFALILPDDTSDDRTAKALSRIEIVSLKGKPKFYIIGMGCADTSLITLEAISYMGKADVFIAPDDIRMRFAKYMGGKPVLFDPLRMHIARMTKKGNQGLSEAELKEKMDRENEQDIQKIKDALDAGKSVALLEYGDPVVYAAWQHRFQRSFKDQIEIVPGLSAFNAANAMIGGNLACKAGSLVLTVPRALAANEDMVKAVSAGGDTMAVFIGLRELKTLVALLQRYYPETTPVQIAYKAGYSNGRHIVKTTLGGVIAAAEKENERHLGMIYIGPCLQ
ncbi:MAG: Precorrin-4 C(11)-methyltransferase [Syntrophorhabdus sp. PtaU1.Bin058]|nr:MAG: Precorrin-4 C(11)-methyltransferase [Syntrophorhabdus sp. PtaU1.Bin058]